MFATLFRLNNFFLCFPCLAQSSVICVLLYYFLSFRCVLFPRYRARTLSDLRRVSPTLVILFIGPIPWGHSGPLCHALSLSLLAMSWTSMRRRRATVPLATPGEWLAVANGPNIFQMLLVLCIFIRRKTLTQSTSRD